MADIDIRSRDDLQRAARENDVNAVIRSLSVPVEGDRHKALALRFLRKQHSVEALPAIGDLLGSPHPVTRGIAARAVGEIGARDPQAALGLLPQLEQLARRDEVWQVRTWSLRSIGLLRHQRALETLIDCSRDDDDRVALAAVWAILTLGDPQGLQAVNDAIPRFGISDLNIIGHARLRLLRRRLKHARVDKA